MLEEPDIEHGEKVIHTLFWLAMTYGLEIDELDGQPIFRFNQNKFGVVQNDVLQDQLQDWLEIAKKEKTGLFATARLYEWMLGYPVTENSFITKELNEFEFDTIEEFEKHTTKHYIKNTVLKSKWKIKINLPFFTSLPFLIFYKYPFILDK